MPFVDIMKRSDRVHQTRMSSDDWERAPQSLYEKIVVDLKECTVTMGNWNNIPPVLSMNAHHDRADRLLPGLSSAGEFCAMKCGVHQLCLTYQQTG